MALSKPHAIASAKPRPAHPKPAHAKKITHPSAPLTEVEIFATPTHKLVGFPDAAPLKRAICNDLDNARLKTIGDLLSASPGAANALRDYAVAHGHVEAGPLKADLALVIAQMVKSGFVIAEGRSSEGLPRTPRPCPPKASSFWSVRKPEGGK